MVNTSELVFNSKRCPGSVVVFKGQESIGIIAKVKIPAEPETTHVFLDTRFDDPGAKAKPVIRGTYASVKTEVQRLNS